MKEHAIKWYEKREKVLAEVKEPEKSRSPRGNSFYYKWPHIRAAFLPVMHKHKMDLRSYMEWDTAANQWVLTMEVIDRETNHIHTDRYPLINESNSNQGMGSCHTYAKRYMFDNIMGIHFGEDDDDGEAGRQAADRGPRLGVALGVDGPTLDRLTLDSLFELCNNAGPKKSQAFGLVLNHFGVTRLQDIPAARKEELRNLIPLIKQLS